MVTDPGTTCQWHRQPYRDPPHIPNLQIVVPRVQNLVKPTGREPVRRLISPRRPVLRAVPPVLPSVRQPIVLRKRFVRRRDRVHVPAHDPAERARLRQQTSDHAHLSDAPVRTLEQRLEMRIDHAKHARARFRPAQQNVRHQRAPPHPSFPKVDAARVGQQRAPRDERDDSVGRASWPAVRRAARNDHKVSSDPRVREQRFERIGLDLLQQDQARRRLIASVFWEDVEPEVV